MVQNSVWYYSQPCLEFWTKQKHHKSDLKLESNMIHWFNVNFMQLIRYNWQLNPFLWSFFSSSAGDGQLVLFDTIWPMFQNFFSSWSLTTCQTYLATTSVPSLPLARLSALEKPSNGSFSTHHSCSSNLALYCSTFLAFFHPQLFLPQFLFSQCLPWWSHSTSNEFWIQVLMTNATRTSKEGVYCTTPRYILYLLALSFCDSPAGNICYVPKTLFSSSTFST